MTTPRNVLAREKRDSKSESKSSGSSPSVDASNEAASTSDFNGDVRRNELTNLGVWVCAAMLLIYAMYFARSLFSPVLFGFFAYMTLRPVVRTAARIGIPNLATATLLMTILAVVIGSGGYLLSGPTQQLLDDSPRIMSDAKEKLSFLSERIKTVSDATSDIAESTSEESESVGEKPVPVEIKQPAWASTTPLIAGTGNLVSFFTIAAVLLYFLMAAGDDLLRGIVGALPTFSSKRRLIEVVDDVQEALSSYLAHVTAINIGLGVAVAIAMWALEVPSPIMWGVMATTLNYVPILGALCGVGVIFTVNLVTFDVTYALIVAGAYLTLTTLEGQVITPWILGKSLRMSSIIVFLSVVVWGWMWGIMGVFLAVPILITLTMVSQRSNFFSGVFALLVDGPKSHPETSSI